MRSSRLHCYPQLMSSTTYHASSIIFAPPARKATKPRILPSRSFPPSIAIQHLNFTPPHRHILSARYHSPSRRRNSNPSIPARYLGYSIRPGMGSTSRIVWQSALAEWCVENITNEGAQLEGSGVYVSNSGVGDEELAWMGQSWSGRGGEEGREGERRSDEY